ncbi:MAG: hypothetical protein FWD55_00440 [Propionibacteriaceae bacterium]|nr:hypothetical protein [Propionibacteriaceae bacterium]
MRTTFLINEDLYSRVKKIAVNQKRTVTSLVDEALIQLAEKYEATEETTGRFYFNALDCGGLLPGIDITNNAQIADILDREEFGAMVWWPDDNA